MPPPPVLSIACAGKVFLGLSLFWAVPFPSCLPECCLSSPDEEELERRLCLGDPVRELPSAIRAAFLDINAPDCLPLSAATEHFPALPGVAALLDTASWGVLPCAEAAPASLELLLFGLLDVR